MKFWFLKEALIVIFRQKASYKKEEIFELQQTVPTTSIRLN